MNRVKCSRCQRKIAPAMSSAQPGDGRPKYQCPCCGYTWTNGKTARQRKAESETHG